MVCIFIGTANVYFMLYLYLYIPRAIANYLSPFYLLKFESTLNSI